MWNPLFARPETANQMSTSVGSTTIAVSGAEAFALAASRGVIGARSSAYVCLLVEPAASPDDAQSARRGRLCSSNRRPHTFWRSAHHEPLGRHFVDQRTEQSKFAPSESRERRPRRSRTFSSCAKKWPKVHKCN